MANDEFGDFQTPLPLATKVLKVLQETKWARILEPTCGQGNFLEAAREAFPGVERVGVEIQESYAKEARQFGTVVVADAMRTDFGRDLHWKATGPLLVVGNPPWVTNAMLSRLGSANKPDLRNVRRLSGLDAMTGASNFDIAESMILKIAADLAEQSPTIAMLCKTQVARNVLSYFEQFHIPLASSTIYGIDAKRWFGAAVDACLFVASIKPDAHNYVTDMYATLDANAPSHQLAIFQGRLVSNVEAYERTRAADGVSPITWRQGVKHDATQVMELVENDGTHTKDGDFVKIEPDYCFPLLKCTDIFRGRTTQLTKWMVVPQRHPGENTTQLAELAPLLWDYLTRNGERLDERKSSIYRGRPRFAIFGVGDYTFAPFKVAISGMHKDSIFRLVGPINGKPVVFDDVCYITPFDDLARAAVTTAILSSEPAQDLISSLVFRDAKRPITKRLLQRIDIRTLSRLVEESFMVASAIDIAHGSGHELTKADASDAVGWLRAEWAVGAESETLVFRGSGPQGIASSPLASDRRLDPYRLVAGVA